VSRSIALATFGRRLFFRFYLYQVILILMGCAATALLWRGVIEPGKDRQRGAVIWVGEWALRQTKEPDQLQRELDEMQKRFAVRVTVYRPGGGIVAHTGALLPPIDGPTSTRLLKEQAVDLPSGSVVVGSTGEGGRLTGYAIMYIRIEESSRAEKYLRVIVILLVLFALGNVPLVRSIARPILKLSGAARAFGGGDMRARAHLRRRDEIGDLARAFDDMADAVEASRRAEKELLANVSHELRTPLARIRVVHELAAEKFPAVAQRYMTEIAEDLGELERLVDDIIRTTRLDLTNARGGDPSPALRLGPLPVGQFVEGLVRRFAELHPDRSMVSKVDYEVSIHADRMMLKRAIGNVLENAHAYSLAGAPISVFVVHDAEAKIVEIRITDRGPGIAADDLPHVSTPFFRADRSRSRNTGGIGLGLSLTRRIIEAHRGSLRIRSSPDEGTTVTMSLPVPSDDDAL